MEKEKEVKNEKPEINVDTKKRHKIKKSNYIIIEDDELERHINEKVEKMPFELKRILAANKVTRKQIRYAMAILLTGGNIRQSVRIALDIRRYIYEAHERMKSSKGYQFLINHEGFVSYVLDHEGSLGWLRQILIEEIKRARGKERLEAIKLLREINKDLNAVKNKINKKPSIKITEK